MAGDGFARVTFQEQVHALREGERLPFGRGADRPLRIEDPRVSRHAGVLFLLQGYAWVRNQSPHNALFIRDGARRVQIPRHLPGQLQPPEPLHSRDPIIELFGATGTLQIRVDTSQLQESGPLQVPESQLTPGTATRLVELRPEDKRLLALLVEPLLRSEGAGRVRTTRELAQALGIDKDAAERRLATLRQRLTDQALPGLMWDAWVDPDSVGAASVNYVERLGEYAYFNGWVGLDDLASS